MKNIFGSLLVVLTFSLTTYAQTFAFFPGAKYDPGVPTLKQVVGHDIGERITLHHEMEQYLVALAKAVPTRLQLFQAWCHVGGPTTLLLCYRQSRQHCTNRRNQSLATEVG